MDQIPGRCAADMDFGTPQPILDANKANDYDNFNKRAKLSAWQKIARIPSLWRKVKAK